MASTVVKTKTFNASNIGYDDVWLTLRREECKDSIQRTVLSDFKHLL